MSVIKTKLDSLGNKVHRFALPIYLLQENAKLQQIGTGCLVTRKNRTLLLTAGHCIESIEEFQRGSSFLGPVCVAFGEKIHYLDVPYKRFRSNPNMSMLDIGILDVTGFKDLIDCASNVLLDIESVPDTHLDGHMISVIGYPSKANKTPVPFDAKNRTRVILHSQSNMGSPLAPHFDLESINLSKKLHYAFQWGRKDEKKQIIPNPRGMSGATVWASTCANLENAIFAGIFIEYHKKREIAVFTRIDWIATFIDSLFGETMGASLELSSEA